MLGHETPSDHVFRICHYKLGSVRPTKSKSQMDPDGNDIFGINPKQD